MPVRPSTLWNEKSVEEAQKADEAGNADIEVCVPIAEEIPENDEIKCYELSGGKNAKIIHKGPYEASGPAYERLFAWLLENDLKLTGPIKEAYLNDPREVAPEEISHHLCAHQLDLIPNPGKTISSPCTWEPILPMISRTYGE